MAVTASLDTLTPQHAKVLELTDQGLGPTAISKKVDLHRTTIHRFLKRVRPELTAVKDFKANLSDTLHLALARYASIEDRLLIGLDDDDVLKAASLSERTTLLGRIAIAKGICYDKIRLQDGKSTSNNSHEIQLNVVHKGMLPPLVSSGVVRSAPEHITAHAEKAEE